MGYADHLPPFSICPFLSQPALEACLDTASGFDPCFSPSLGREGRWIPNLGWGVGGGGSGPTPGRRHLSCRPKGPGTRKAALFYPVGWGSTDHPQSCAVGIKLPAPQAWGRGPHYIQLGGSGF